jgi:hypothetical protein
MNSSRVILYASKGNDFAQAARSEVQRTLDVLNTLRV